MICTAYMSSSERGNQITPLFQIEIKVDGDDSLVNEIKDLLTSDMNYTAQMELLEKEFNPNTDVNGDVVLTKDGATATLTINKTNLLDGLTVQNLLDKIGMPNLELNKDTSVTILLKEDYRRLYPNLYSDAVFDKENKAIVIGVMTIDDIQDLKKYIKDPGAKNDAILDNYLYVIQHELAHHNIETKEEFQNYRNIQDNAENYTEQQSFIAAQISNTRYANLKLHLQGTTNYPKFYTELFAWQEADKEFKTLLEGNRHYQNVLAQQPEQKESKPREETTEFFNETEVDKYNMGVVPENIGNLGVGELKAYREYLDIAYGEYIPIDDRANNYTAQIHGFRPGELIYIQWTVKGDEKRPSANFIKSITRSGNDIKLVVSGRQYDPKQVYDKTGKTDNRIWADKKITIKSNGTIESEKLRDKESEYKAKIVAFRKFAGRPIGFTNNGINRNIDKDEKNLIQSNTKNWFQATSNAKKISAYMEKYKVGVVEAERQLIGELEILDGKQPKFLSTTFGQRHDSKDDIGFYFKIDNSSSTTEVQNAVTSVGDRLVTKAGNNEALNDASYNLIKVGDVVTYKKWSEKKTTFHDVVVLKTFKEGLLVQNIVNGEVSGESYTIRRKDLFAVYSFFNKGEKDESNIINILKEFKEISDELYSNRPTAKENTKKTVFTLKELADPKLYNYDSYSFRTFAKDKDDSYAISKESSFFHPSEATINYIYGKENFPSEEYQKFEKELSKVPTKVYNALKEKSKSNKQINFYTRDLEDLNPNGSHRKDSFGNELTIGPIIVDLLSSRGDLKKLQQYLEMQTVKKHRYDKLALLKSGSYVLLNKRKKEKETFKVLEQRQPVYGVVLARSKDFLTVAIPNLQWDNELKRYNDFENFKIIQINVMDFRADKEYDVSKVFNNMNFERSLINTLATLKQLVSKTVVENNKTKSQSAEQQVKEMLTRLEAEIELMGYESEQDKPLSPNRISDFYTMVSFYTNFDYIIEEEKERLRLKPHDIEARNQDRQYYVSMLETGSIAQYKYKAYRKNEGPLQHGLIKNFMVIGKDIQTGRPILADIVVKTKNNFTFSYVNPFVADIDSIVGVGFLKETIEAKHFEVDNTESIVRINPSSRFIDDQKELLKQYVLSQQVNKFNTEEEAQKKKNEVLETQRKYSWKFPPDLYIMKTGEIELVYKTRKGERTYRKQVQLDKEGKRPLDQKYKNQDIIEGSIKLGLFQKWDDGSLKPYSDKNYHLTFSFKNKDNKWIQPKGLRIIDSIVRGTVVNYTYDKGSKTYFGSGIVLYKEASYLMLLKFKQDSEDPKDFDEIDVETIDMDDIKMFPLYHGSVNVGDAKNPNYALVLKNVRSLTFTQGINRTQFDTLKVDSDVSKQGKTNERIYRSDVLDSTIVQRESKTKIMFSKHNLSREEKLQDIEDLRKYQDKFKALYNIDFKLLSRKEIQETYDNKPEYNNGVISNYRAFKVNDDYIVINTDLASLAAPFHEMSHFAIEALYKTNRELYNELIQATKQHPLQKTIALNYPELSGRDLDEEVFTSILGYTYSEHISNNPISNWEKKHESLLGRFLDQLRRLLRRLIGKDIDIDINDKELVQNRQKDVLIAFGEDLESGKFVEDVRQLNVNEYLKLHENDFAVKVLSKLLDNNGIMMSSFALAQQGYVERDYKQKMNDVDIIIPAENDSFRNNPTKWMEKLFGEGNVKLLNDFKDYPDATYTNKFYLVATDKINHYEMKSNGFLKGSQVDIDNDGEWIKVDVAQYDKGKQPALFNTNTIHQDSVLKAKQFLADRGEQKHIKDLENWYGKTTQTSIKALKNLKEKLIADGNLNIYCL